MPAVGPSASRKYSGMMLASPVKRTFDHRLAIELVSSLGCGWQLAALKARSTMRRFCILGVNKHKGSWAASNQVTAWRRASG